ncbi:MAG: AraC family transcriptional regulator [Thermoanaerobaculia bacterium]
MRYHEYRPQAELRDFVHCIWMMERDYAAGGEETIWPDGRSELIFHYGARYTADRLLPATFLLGPLSARLRLTAHGRLRLIGVRFRAWGFTSLFRIPASELLDRAVDVHHLAREIEERLYDATDESALAILESFLLRRARRVGLDPIVTPIRRVIGDPIGTNIDRLAIDCALSNRQLERRFVTMTGLPPKRLAVIARFNAVRRHLIANPMADVTDVAHRFGFSDYAHLSRDFQRFLGTTPAQFEQQMRMVEPRRDVVFLQDEND